MIKIFANIRLVLDRAQHSVSSSSSFDCIFLILLHKVAHDLHLRSSPSLKRQIHLLPLKRILKLYIHFHLLNDLLKHCQVCGDDVELSTADNVMSVFLQFVGLTMSIKSEKEFTLSSVQDYVQRPGKRVFDV